MKYLDDLMDEPDDESAPDPGTGKGTGPAPAKPPEVGPSRSAVHSRDACGAGSRGPARAGDRPTPTGLRPDGSGAEQGPAKPAEYFEASAVDSTGFAGDEGRPTTSTERPAGPELYRPVLLTGLPAIPNWEPPPDPPDSAGRSAPKGGSDKQNKWAERIKGAAVPSIRAALADLLHERGEDDLKDVGRGVVLELLDRLDSRQWIDWSLKGKGAVDTLVLDLWWMCRAQAAYRRALPGARAWRGGLAGVGDLAHPAGAQEPLALAQRVGYAVVGAGEMSLLHTYTTWCRARRIACVVIDDTGGYLGGVEYDPGAVARVHATPPDTHAHFSGAGLAEMEATCRVCMRPGGPPSDVSIDPRGVIAIVPSGLARPLAARLHLVASRHVPLRAVRGLFGPRPAGQVRHP